MVCFRCRRVEVIPAAAPMPFWEVARGNPPAGARSRKPFRGHGPCRQQFPEALQAEHLPVDFLVQDDHVGFTIRVSEVDIDSVFGSEVGHGPFMDDPGIPAPPQQTAQRRLCDGLLRQAAPSVRASAASSGQPPWKSRRMRPSLRWGGLVLRTYVPQSNYGMPRVVSRKTGPIRNRCASAPPCSKKRGMS
ncbi:MAG: hypothetical protein RLY31_1430 [Bacteroidota bacterium]